MRPWHPYSAACVCMVVDYLLSIGNLSRAVSLRSRQMLRDQMPLPKDSLCSHITFPLRLYRIRLQAGHKAVDSRTAIITPIQAHFWGCNQQVHYSGSELGTQSQRNRFQIDPPTYSGKGSTCLRPQKWANLCTMIDWQHRTG